MLQQLFEMVENQSKKMDECLQNQKEKKVCEKKNIFCCSYVPGIIVTCSKNKIYCVKI